MAKSSGEVVGRRNRLVHTFVSGIAMSDRLSYVRPSISGTRAIHELHLRQGRPGPSLRAPLRAHGCHDYYRHFTPTSRRNRRLDDAKAQEAVGRR